MCCCTSAVYYIIKVIPIDFQIQIAYKTVCTKGRGICVHVYVYRRKVLTGAGEGDMLEKETLSPLIQNLNALQMLFFILMA